MAKRRPRTRSVVVRQNRVRIAAVLSVVLIVMAFLTVHAARTSKSFVVTSDGSFTDQANVLLADSAALNNELNAVVLVGPTANRQALLADLTGLTQSAARTASSAELLKRTATTNNASHLVASALSNRSEAVALLAKATVQVLTLQAVPGSATTALADAVAKTDASVVELTKARAALWRGPAKAQLAKAKWDDFRASLTPQGQATFLSRLASSPGLAAQHNLAISAISVTPSALPLQSTGTNIVLLPTTSIGVGVVIANHGNVDEAPVAIVITLLGLDNGVSKQATAHVRIEAATSEAVSRRTFKVKPGDHYRLVVTILPPPRSTQTGPITSIRTITIARQ